jgi:hypothetical protein
VPPVDGDVEHVPGIEHDLDRPRLGEPGELTQIRLGAVPVELQFAEAERAGEPVVGVEVPEVGRERCEPILEYP